MNLFAFVSVFLGVFAWVLVMAFMDGLQHQSRDQMLKENPHLLWEGSVREDLAERFEDVERVLGEAARSIEFSLQTEGLLERPSSEAQERGLEAVVMQGDSSIERGKVVLGEDLAAGLGVVPGDLLELKSIWKLEGSPLGVRVDSVFSSEVYEIDKRVVRVAQKDLEEWLGFRSAVSRIALQIKDPFRAEVYQKQLHASLGVEFKTWRQVDESYWYSLKLERLAMALSMFFVIALAALSVNMALSARVAERSREISLLRALGLPKAEIFKLYVFEGTFIGGASIVSALLLAPLCAFYVSKNFRLPDYYHRTDLPLHWDLGALTILSLLSLFLCVWASWKPARRAMETAVAAGLRF